MLQCAPSPKRMKAICCHMQPTPLLPTLPITATLLPALWSPSEGHSTGSLGARAGPPRHSHSNRTRCKSRGAELPRSTY